MTDFYGTHGTRQKTEIEHYRRKAIPWKGNHGT